MQDSYQPTLRWAAAIVVAVGLFMPYSIGGALADRENPYRVLATLLLVILAVWYVVAGILSEPRGAGLWRWVRLVLAVAAITLVYGQIILLKDQLTMRRHGPWHADMLWPSGGVIGCVALFGVLTADNRRMIEMDRSSRVEPGPPTL